MEDKSLRAAGFFPRLAAYILDRLILGVLLFVPRVYALATRLGSDALSRAVEQQQDQAGGSGERGHQ